MVLSERLKEAGYEGTPKEFREEMQELRAVMFPAWTDEELLFHPTEALKFVREARSKTGLKKCPEDLFLRTLVNLRKSRKAWA